LRQGGKGLAYMKKDKKLQRIILFPVLLMALGLSFMIAVRWGSVEFSNQQIIGLFFGYGEEDAVLRTIIYNIRLPRTLTALMVGANLAMSGALLQAVMRNELADPGLTGISTGAALGAVTVMLVFPAYGALVPVVAFSGAAIACAIVFALSWKRGVDPIRIVLAGVAVNAVLGGGTGLLSILYSDRIQGVLMWLNGTLSGRSWQHVEVLFPYSVLGLVAAGLCIKAANLLQLGDEMAKNLGLKVHLARIALSAVAAFIAAISVSMVGLIGFVGLIIPHITRLLVGSDYRYLLPGSALLGAVFLLSADTAARMVFSPIELPVGIIMAIIGGPFFLYLLRKGGKYKV